MSSMIPMRWSVGPKSIILEVKTFSNDSKVKYHGTYNTDGHAVITKYSFKASFDYNIVTKRISVFVFNAIFVFYIDFTYFL
jgi:hypothetical protein